MTFETKTHRIQKTKTRVLWYTTINGKRLTSTNYSKKWEAEELLKNVIAHYGKTEILKRLKRLEAA